MTANNKFIKNKINRYEFHRDVERYMRENFPDNPLALWRYIGGTIMVRQRATEYEIPDVLLKSKTIQYEIDVIPLERGKKNGKRRARHEQDTDRIKAWFISRLEDIGLTDIKINVFERSIGNEISAGKGNTFLKDGYFISGELKLSDAKKLSEKVNNGIGGGKAYGYGLLAFIGTNENNQQVYL